MGMHSAVLQPDQRKRFIAAINRKWQQKFQKNQAWLDELERLS